MKKITLPSSLTRSQTVALTFAKKYGVAIAATTACIVVMSKIKDEEKAEAPTPLTFP